MINDDKIKKLINETLKVKVLSYSTINSLYIIAFKHIFGEELGIGYIYEDDNGNTGYTGFDTVEDLTLEHEQHISAKEIISGKDKKNFILNPIVVKQSFWTWKTEQNSGINTVAVFIRDEALAEIAHLIRLIYKSHVYERMVEKQNALIFNFEEQYLIRPYEKHDNMEIVIEGEDGNVLYSKFF